MTKQEQEFNRNKAEALARMILNFAKCECLVLSYAPAGCPSCQLFEPSDIDMSHMDAVIQVITDRMQSDLFANLRADISRQT